MLLSHALRRHYLMFLIAKLLSCWEKRFWTMWHKGWFTFYCNKTPPSRKADIFCACRKKLTSKNNALKSFPESNCLKTLSLYLYDEHFDRIVRNSLRFGSRSWHVKCNSSLVFVHPKSHTLHVLDHCYMASTFLKRIFQCHVTEFKILASSIMILLVFWHYIFFPDNGNINPTGGNLDTKNCTSGNPTNPCNSKTVSNKFILNRYNLVHMGKGVSVM